MYKGTIHIDVDANVGPTARSPLQTRHCVQKVERFDLNMNFNWTGSFPRHNKKGDMVQRIMDDAPPRIVSDHSVRRLPSTKFVASGRTEDGPVYLIGILAYDIFS